MNSPGFRPAPAPLNALAPASASASASASARLGVFDGEWQQIAAAAVQLGVLAALRGFRGKYPAQNPPERTLQHPEEAAQHPTEEAGRGSPSAS